MLLFQVFVAGSDAEAKETVVTMTRRMGFTPVDMGSLLSAREIEDIPVQRFSTWRLPLIVSTAIFVFFWVIGFAK